MRKLDLNPSDVDYIVANLQVVETTKHGGQFKGLGDYAAAKLSQHSAATGRASVTKPKLGLNQTDDYKPKKGH